MSENDVSDSNAEAKEPSIFDQNEGVDWFVAWVIFMAEKFNIEMGVTLTVGGTAISGQVVSGRRFFDEITKGIKTAGGNADSELLSDISTWTERFVDVYTGTNHEDYKLEDHKPAYIHMVDALFFNDSNGPIARPGSPWRGKASAIDGISITSIK